MNENLLNLILNHFGISGVFSFEKIQKGFLSDNYKIETRQGIFFLKTHRLEAVKELDSIERAEQFFLKGGIPIIPPKRTLDGSLHTVHENTYYTLYPFVEGSHHVRGAIPELSLTSMAKTLAALHLLTKDGILGTYEESIYFRPRNADKILAEITALEEIVSVIEDKSDFDNDVLKGFVLKRKLIEQYKHAAESLVFPDRNLCHGDYQIDNMFFNAADAVSAVFDLDMSGTAPRAYEVVRCFMLSCLDNVYTEERIKQAQVFVRAYAHEYPFTKEQFEDAFEAYFLKAFWSTWIERAHYQQSITRTDVLYAPNMRTVEYLAENRDILFARLCEEVTFAD